MLDAIVFIAVILFIILLIAAAIGIVINGLVESQETVKSGLQTKDMSDRELVFHVQTISDSILSPVDLNAKDNASYFQLRVSMDFAWAAVQDFNGSALFGISQLDPPLMMLSNQATVWTMDNNTRSVKIIIEVASGIELAKEGTYNIFFYAQYDVSVPSLGDFSGVLRDSSSLKIHPANVGPGWYLLFIFLGILVSFWWRIANTYLKGEPVKPTKEDLKIAYFLLLPVFSVVIALVVFQQFLNATTLTNSLFLNGVIGFVYGFFWENATKKLGDSVNAALTVAGSK